MVSALLPLRPYQEEALQALIKEWAEGERNRLAIVLPTGGGKTVCFAHLAARHIAEHPAERVIILVHTDELVRQSVKKVLDVAPHLEVGIVQGKRNDVRADVIVASVMSLRSKARRDQIRGVGLVIVDECHHATAATYRAILEHFGCFGGRVKAAGFTATLMRADAGDLTKVWGHSAVFTLPISWMVRRRFLIPPRGKAVVVPDLNLANVKSTKADYREGELGEALSESLAPELIAKAVKEHAPDRKTLAFFPTVASGYVFAEAFEAEGIPCEVIHGALPIEERRAILLRHRKGTVVANCMVLTEGYDDPEVDCIVIGRPTKSKGLYIQIVGRGLRVDESRPYDEQDCLLLDVVGASAMHDLRSLSDLSEKPIPKDPDGTKTLIELEDELDAGEGVEADEVEFYRGPVEVHDFDPLAQKSSKAWNRTKKGAFFLPVGKGTGYVFLVPAAGKTYTVAWCSISSTRSLYLCGGVPREVCRCGGQCKKRPGALTEHRELSLEMAMSWAEDLAVDMGTSLQPNKRAPWRRAAPSDKMKGLARVRGVTVKELMSAGELSDAIAKVEASSRVDPIVAHFVKQEATA